MKAFDAHVGTCNGKVGLFIDNCPAHLTVQLRITQLVFLLQNTISGIIQLVKKKFRDILVHNMVVRIDINQPQRKWDGLRAIRAIRTSWDAVAGIHRQLFLTCSVCCGQPEQIMEKVDDNPDCLPARDDKVVAKLGDEAASPQRGTSAEPQPGTSHDIFPFSLLLPFLYPRKIAAGVAYEDYLTIDDTPACEALDDEDLISGHKESTDGEWEGKDVVPKPREDMLEAIEMLTNSMLHSDADS
ncbi:hypothetical protein PR048_008409 [Dryococelus australis]|uniref:DDE-1 domain-containing protein n=1 Tax=Dryococelus australis TaxID=614101 RepID=A0ABQ9HX09_9NEOP|nr:hypothetical protein PR048_008409 [Dryococelus australis]